MSAVELLAAIISMSVKKEELYIRMQAFQLSFISLFALDIQFSTNETAKGPSS